MSADEIAEKYFPNEPLHIVPLSIGLALVTRSAEQTALLAANIGGDADSVASIGAAIAAAFRPNSVNQSWFQTVYSVNPAECGVLMELAAELAVKRLHGHSGV